MIPRSGTTAATALQGSVDVVIVNWNAGDQLRECVTSVKEREPLTVAKVIVVDNGSIDESVARLPAWNKLKIDEIGKNLGFGRACNRGAAQGNAPLILLLNPDTRLTEQAISAAAAFLLSPPRKGTAVCGIALRDDDGHVTRHCARFPSLGTFVSLILGLDKIWPGPGRTLLMEDFDHLSDRQVDHVQGAFYMIRRDVFEAMAGFDEEYFVYFEDLDLSLRVQEAGYKIQYMADIQAYHRGGGTSAQVKARARFYGIEARMLYAHKHFGRVANLVHSAMTLLIEPPMIALWYSYRYGWAGLRAAREVSALLYRNAPRMVWRTKSRQLFRGRAR